MPANAQVHAARLIVFVPVERIGVRCKDLEEHSCTSGWFVSFVRFLDPCSSVLIGGQSLSVVLPVVIKDESSKLGLGPEIHEQAHLNPGSSKVVHQLCFVGALDRTPPLFRR